MTREKWATMSYRQRNCWLYDLTHPEDKGRFDLEHTYAPQPPDYCNDLNAACDLVRLAMEANKYADYWTSLRTVFFGKGLHFSSYAFHNATAAQRAEAFALTMEPEE